MNMLSELDQYNLTQLRNQVIQEMSFIEMSLSNEEQYIDAVSSFNVTLRKYRDMCAALQHKLVYCNE